MRFLADGATIPSIHLTGFAITIIVSFLVGVFIGKKL